MPFSAKWFLLYYGLSGVILILSGTYLVFQNEKISRWFSKVSEQKKPPILLIRIVKYGVLFALPGLVLSIFPFSWIELLFSIWSLLLLYIAATQLVQWQKRRKLIMSSKESLPVLVRRSGAIMMAVGFAILLLAYLVVLRAT